MATDGGPNIERDGLVFGMDTGYGVANNSTSTRFYPGEPTTNLRSDGQADGILYGMQGVSVTYIGQEDGWSKYSMSGTFSAGTYPYCMYLRGQSFTGGTRFSTQVKIKTNVGIKFNYFGSNGVSYVNQPMDNGGVNSSTLLPDGSKLLQRQGFAYTSTTSQTGYLWTNPINGTTFNSSTDFVYVKEFQIEQNVHCTPFVSDVRTSTQSLIDLKKTTDIDVSNVSFNSTGQPTFDGTNDYVNLGNTNVFSQFTTDFTISAYAKRLNSGGAWGNLVGDYYTNNIDGEWQLAMSNGGAFFFYRVGTGYIFSPTANYGSNLWHYVAITRVGPTISLYVNGNLINTVSNSLIFGSSSGNVNVGIDGNNSSEPFTGEIAVVKIYNRGLSIQEVQQNYNTYKNRFDT